MAKRNPSPLSWAEFRAERDRLMAENEAASRAWNALPGVSSGPMGLTPDAVKASPAYRAARARYEASHAALRAFNRAHAASFTKETAREIVERRAARLAQINGAG